MSVKTLGFILGLSFLLTTILLPAPGDMPVSAWHTAGIALLIATWWATEAIPIPVTSLLPILLFPALEIMNIKASTAHYADPIIFLLLGGFIIATGLSKWNLHRRLALNILNRVGNDPSSIVAGFMMTTAFLSMWISNTAGTIMMIPIALSLASEVVSDKEESHHNFTICLLLGIAYAATIGGIGTIIGSPPNAYVVGYLAENHAIEISFVEWMMFGVPFAIVMLGSAWWVLAKWVYYFDSKEISVSSDFIATELKAMGKFTKQEQRLALVFLFVVVAWIGRPILKNFGIMPWLDDTMIAVAGIVLMFIVPSGQSEQKYSALLDWESANKIPWGVLLLVGGGLSLSGAIKESGLAVWLGQNLPSFSGLEVIFSVICLIIFIVFLTELTSNTATMATLAPILGSFASVNGIDLHLIFVVAVFSVSSAFMLPVATPPNAIVFATGWVTIPKMAKAGFRLSIIAIIMITILSYLLVPLIFG
ncbi:MAG: DASS family sodium-coupled anion symporter [Nitrosomonas sp.]|nr:DASS family sodium-coupled anion symporter [Nitrosomonas sp.]